MLSAIILAVALTAAPVAVDIETLKSGDLPTKRAAAFRPMEPKAYSNDKAVADAATAMMNIDFDTNLEIEKSCMQRLNTSEAK